MKKTIIIILAASISMMCAITANHLPPSGFLPDQQTELKVEIIQGWDDISEAEIMYRLEGSELFEPVPLEKDAIENFWMKGSLPVSGSAEKPYEYYFRFTLNNGSVETLPVIKPEEHPYVILPSTKSGNLSQDFILLSTETTTTTKDGYILAVSWYALEGIIDKESIRVYVNDKDVTKNATISNNMLLYKDKSPKPGIIAAYITATTYESREIYSDTWKTIVKPSGNSTDLPLNLRGSLNAGTNIYATANDSEAPTFGSDRDDGWANLEMFGQYEQLKLQTYAYLSTLQEEDVQNVNRLRMGILLPFWDTYVGDYTPTFSSLTMNSRNVRGIYTRLHSKYFGLSFAHGQIIRKIDGKETVNPVTKEVDYSAGTFKQEALAARIQLGSDNGFLMGLTTTRNRDVISSLDDKYIIKTTATDTTQMAFPKDNLVLSMDTKISIPQANLVMGAEIAGSLYNYNTYPGPLNKDDLEEYFDTDNFPVNPADFQDIFIINTNMEPMPMQDHFDDVVSALSSITAWQAYLRNVLYNNMFNFSVSQTGASFHALSAGYKQNDATQWTFSDMYNFKQLWFLSGGYNLTNDNLSKTNLDTNTYNNLYLQSILRLPQYPWLTLSYTNGKGKNKLNNEIVLTDSSLYMPYKRNSDSFSIGVGYEFAMLPVAPTTVDINWRTGSSEEKREDENKSLSSVYDYKNYNISLNLTSKFIDIPLKTRLAIANNTQNEDTAGLKTSNFNFLMRGDYKFMDNMLIPWLEYRNIFLGGDQAKQAYNYLTFGLDAHPLEFTNVSTSLGWLFYGNTDVDNANYTTTTWRFNIIQRF